MGEEKKGFFKRLVSGLTKTRDNIVSGMDSIFHGFSKIDDDFYEELEETLIMGDLGVRATMDIIEDLKVKVKEQHIKEPIECRQLVIDSIREQMDVGETAYEFENRQSVVFVIGVNGVGKTTTTLSIGVALAKENKKVLLVDADPQGNLTTSLGYYEQEDMPVTLADLMYAEIMDKEIKIHDAILHHEEKIDLIPSDISLSAIELSLGNAMSREFILKNCLNTVKNEYDYILIDCMPSLGLIPINCLACSNEIIIPVQSQYLAMRGMTYLFETVSKVRRTINPNLRVKGILLTLVDRRANLSKNVRQELDKNYGKYVKIYDTEIPLAIKTAEASIRGKSIFEYDKKGTVAKAYENLVEEVLNDERTKS